MHIQKSRVAAKYVAITDQPVRESGTDKLLRVLVQPRPEVLAITIIRRLR